MNLKYFSLGDDKDVLKAKYKKLALKFHPDKNLNNQEESNKIMQDIHEELEYCIKNGRAFDISKLDLNNPRQLRDFARNYIRTVIDEMINGEPNVSVRIFAKTLKNQFENIIDGNRNRPIILREKNSDTDAIN